MKKSIKTAALSLALLAGTVGTSLVLTTQNSVACTGVQCVKDGANKAQTGGKTTSLSDMIQTITDVLLYLIGAVSVIMIVIGGFKYVTSNGNPEQVKSAKNTIMYAVIGIAVAIMAYAIVKWIIGQLA